MEAHPIMHPKETLNPSQGPRIPDITDAHMTSVLPAELRDMTATVRNADIQTSIRDGLERTTDRVRFN